MSYGANNLPVDMDWNMLPSGEVTEIDRTYSEETMISFMGACAVQFQGQVSFHGVCKTGWGQQVRSEQQVGDFPFRFCRMGHF